MERILHFAARLLIGVFKAVSTSMSSIGVFIGGMLKFSPLSNKIISFLVNYCVDLFVTKSAINSGSNFDSIFLAGIDVLMCETVNCNTNEFINLHKTAQNVMNRDMDPINRVLFLTFWDNITCPYSVLIL